MKLMRIRDEVRDIPCVLDTDGIARDVSSLEDDFGPGTIDGLVNRLGGTLSQLPALETAGKSVAAPMAQPRNIYCIGLNSSDHAAEANIPIPNEPILFNKSAVTYCGPDDPILNSPNMTKLNREVELGIVIGWSVSFEHHKGYRA